MVFFIIYGLFIKDSTPDEFIKQPQTAPVLPSNQIMETPQATTKPVDVNIPKEVEHNEPEAETTAEKTEPKTEPTKTPESTPTEKESVKTTATKTVEKTPSKTEAKAATTPTPTNKTTNTTTTKVPLPRIEPDSKTPPVPKVTTTHKATKTEPLPLPPKPATEPVIPHSVYVRGFTSEKAAQEAATELSKNPKTKAIVTHKNGQVVLQFGTFSDKTNAEKFRQELKTQNINAQTD